MGLMKLEGTWFRVEAKSVKSGDFVAVVMVVVAIVKCICF